MAAAYATCEIGSQRCSCCYNGINKISLRERRMQRCANWELQPPPPPLAARTNRRIVRFGVCVGRLTHSAGGCVGLWIASKALYAAWDKRIEVAGRECARALLKHSFKAPHVHRIRIMCSSSRDAASRTASRTVENAYDGNHVFG
jgi:hypothetical protein